MLLAVCLGCEETVTATPAGPIADWPHYGADPGGTRFSPLTQINPGNVDGLRIAWTYHTGDVVERTAQGLG